MSFLNKLPFGKKKAEVDTDNDNFGMDNFEQDKSNTRPTQESGLDSISESVLESIVQNDENYNEAQTVAGSSSNLSPESIIATETGADPALRFEEVKPPAKLGFGAKLKSMFGSKEKLPEMRDVEPYDFNQSSQDRSGVFNNESEAVTTSDDGLNFAMEQGVNDGIGRMASSSDDAQAQPTNNNREMRDAEIIQDIGRRPKPIPLIGKLSAKKQYTVSFSVFVTAMLAAGVLSTNGFLQSSFYKERVNSGIRIQLLAQSIQLNAQNFVSNSNSVDVTALQQTRLDLERLNKVLQDESASSPEASEAQSLISKEIIPRVDRVLSTTGELRVSGAAGELSVLSQNSQALEESTHTLYMLADQLATYLESSPSSRMQSEAANHMRVLTERISRNGANMLTSNSASILPLTEFNSDFSEVKRTLATFWLGDDKTDMAPIESEQATLIMNEMARPIKTIENVVGFVSRNATNLIQARLEVSEMTGIVNKAVSLTDSFTSAMTNKSDQSLAQIYLALGFAIFGLSALALLGLVNNRLTHLEAWEAAYKNKNNEKDIIDFMTEIAPLEMGDLTVGFTNNVVAMEGITGGIRSSVSEAVSSLRTAMSTVLNTTGSVMSNVSDSVESSRDLQNSNDRQSKEIDDVVGRVANLTSAIDQVTNNTIRAADMTTSAKAASDAGVRVVSETNQKMTEIRNSMQDVLKSVKHLGETSHEIGTIVEAIETITDRTQVIAVNASLEAAKAGAAGQGFQVLAGEVNRLAEQSNEALRTITALVQRIQGETASTIRVVEDSTNNVVEGAQLSETANLELSKISHLSEQLQGVMVQIRQQSENQSTNAGSVRDSMDRLSALSNEFQSSVSRMVAGVQQIDASMGTLQSTVAVFTIEDQAA